MYQQGVGAPLDYDEAVKWFKLAAAQGDKFGQKKLELLTLYQSSVRALANRPAPSNGPALLVGSVDVSRFGGLRYGDTIERAMQILGVPTGSGANGETSIMFDGVGLTLEYDTSHRITSIEALDLLNPEFLKSHGGLDGLPAMLGQRRDALTPLGSPTKTLPANADEPNGLQDGVWYFTIDGRQGELRICCVNAKPDAEAVGSIGLKWGSPVNPSLQASTSVGR
jgi:hypothetical protein